MGKTNERAIGRMQRKTRIRKKMRPERGVPRLCVFRSNQHIYAQLVNDLTGKVMAAASTINKDKASKKNNVTVDAAKEVGRKVGQQALQQNVEQVFFDRNGYKYHGRIKALADAAREAGLKF